MCLNAKKKDTDYKKCCCTSFFHQQKKAPILNRCLNYHLLINLYTRKYTTHEYTNIQRFFHCIFLYSPSSSNISSTPSR